MKLLCVCLCLIQAVFGLDEIEAFSKSKITPDVITNAPNRVLKVEYKKSGQVVALGNELQPKDVRDEPHVSYTGEPKAFYTLVMIDPDAPSRDKHTMREWNHWTVVNIPGADISKGETINEYVGSGPPKDTGLHRYVFLLFKQPGKVSFNEEHKTNTNGKRGKFSTEAFAKKYNLGNPVAGNYFEAKFDESVPELHSKLH